MTTDSSVAIYEGLKKAGINFIVSVPCVNLKKLLNLIDDDPEIKHVPVTIEAEGFGICAGAYMGGKNVAILMQNSGLGNSVNALTSLFELYKFPILMIISQRGSPGESIVGQVPMGKATTKVLDAINIRYYMPKTPSESLELVYKGWNLSKTSLEPFALLFEIRYW
ncbi:MAG: sulfopyruvate decarboxylase subunit alpha [Methanobacteriaceae archaeon]|nr:sulfopyruvate decarboxylase subunit alpha [Methanobacteriaceae archaeon]